MFLVRVPPFRLRQVNRSPPGPTKHSSLPSQYLARNLLCLQRCRLRLFTRNFYFFDPPPLRSLSARSLLGFAFM